MQTQHLTGDIRRHLETSGDIKRHQETTGDNKRHQDTPGDTCAQMAESSNQKQMMNRVSHQQASQLLHNKCVVVLGDSIQRSVYKDLVLLLQKDKYLSRSQLKSKGEMSFEQDCLVEGGCLGEMHNGTEYREVRQFQSDHHLVRFYFVTRVFSSYVQRILEDFRKGLKPDVIIINSCVWDISRYNSSWHDTYKENLHKFFDDLKGIVPEETLVIWNLTMPLGERITGGFLVPEIKDKAPHLRYDVIEANFYSGILADAYGMDVLDLHFQFRFSLQHRTTDGVHWNAVAHRRITSLLLEHSAQAWGVVMPCALTAVEHTEDSAQKPAKENVSKPAVRHPSRGRYNGYREAFFGDAVAYGYLNFENQRPYHMPPPHFRNGFDYRPPYDERHQRNVMRSRHARPHYTPYTHHRPHQYGRRGSYYY
ncbi:PC-esterase domain-containing protein 1A-like isoform X4 [Sebastes umbrosus]|uniref:PC-esterase domain-containing protein 1A-like isoform X4 n=1 Tax=Sebastes umbrosus TaxID=72105 RepID=UPI00189D9178|nr:PC-esterase domain-containing protein 1A-like isoform X4 [Sebastes umbrosus]